MSLRVKLVRISALAGDSNAGATRYSMLTGPMAAGVAKQESNITNTSASTSNCVSTSGHGKVMAPGADDPLLF